MALIANAEAPFPEHAHKWMPSGKIVSHYVSGDEAHVFAERLKCEETMDWEEMMRRLNAAERLSAARETSTSIQQLLEWAMPWLLGKKMNVFLAHSLVLRVDK